MPGPCILQLIAVLQSVNVAVIDNGPAASPAHPDDFKRRESALDDFIARPVTAAEKAAKAANQSGRGAALKEFLGDIDATKAAKDDSDDDDDSVA